MSSMPRGPNLVRSLPQNFVASVAGRSWSAALSFVLVPIYIRVLGVEAYGIIVLFASAQAVMVFLDLGLSTALNRELASLQIHRVDARGIRDTVRTLELLYWGAAVFMAVASMPAARLLTAHWVRPVELPPASVVQALGIMGVALATQFPYTLYAAGLMGVQRHVLLNRILIAATSVRALGTLAVLYWLAPTVQGFMTWQAVSGLIQSSLGLLGLWRSLPPSGVRARFIVGSLRHLSRFSVGVFGISATALILTQADKILLSRLLTLDALGYYGLASLAASVLSLVALPLFNTVFPRLTSLAAARDEARLGNTYRAASQAAAVLVVPAATVLILFSRDLLWLWTRDVATADQAHRLVSLLAIGTALNGIAQVPYALQLALGWTKLAFVANSLSIMVLLPLLVFLVPRWGAFGAALVWIALNVGYVVFVVAWMHRKVLVGELRRWYISDVGLPAVAALAAATVTRALVGRSATDGDRLLSAVAAGSLAILAAGLAASEVRGWAFAGIRRLAATITGSSR